MKPNNLQFKKYSLKEITSICYNFLSDGSSNTTESSAIHRKKQPTKYFQNYCKNLVAATSSPTNLTLTYSSSLRRQMWLGKNTRNHYTSNQRSNPLLNRKAWLPPKSPLHMIGTWVQTLGRNNTLNSNTRRRYQEWWTPSKKGWRGIQVQAPVLQMKGTGRTPKRENIMNTCKDCSQGLVVTKYLLFRTKRGTCREHCINRMPRKDYRRTKCLDKEDIWVCTSQSWYLSREWREWEMKKITTRADLLI